MDPELSTSQFHIILYGESNPTGRTIRCVDFRYSVHVFIGRSSSSWKYQSKSLAHLRTCHGYTCPSQGFSNSFVAFRAFITTLTNYPSLHRLSSRAHLTMREPIFRGRVGRGRNLEILCGYVVQGHTTQSHRKRQSRPSNRPHL